MPKVGHVIKAITKNVIGNDSAKKYHLCVCSVNNYYLYMCRRGFRGDFPVSAIDFEELTPEVELTEDVSYLSLSRVIQVSRFRPNQQPALICNFHDATLRRIVRHVDGSRLIAPRDKARIIDGIARYLNEQNA